MKIMVEDVVEIITECFDIVLCINNKKANLQRKTDHFRGKTLAISRFTSL